MGGHLRLAGAGEHPLHIQATDAHNTLHRRKVCEVPDLHPGHVIAGRRRLQVDSDELSLVLFGPHHVGMAMHPRHGISTKLRHDDRSLPGRPDLV